jgi:hypothetical protein
MYQIIIIKGPDRKTSRELFSKSQFINSFLLYWLVIPCLWHTVVDLVWVSLFWELEEGGASFLSPWGPKFSWWICMYILVCTSKQGYIGKWTCENIKHYTYTIVWNCVFIAVLHNKGGHGNNIVWKLCAWCHTHYKQYGYNKAILCSVLSLSEFSALVCRFPTM